MAKMRGFVGEEVVGFQGAQKYQGLYRGDMCCLRKVLTHLSSSSGMQVS